LYACDVPPEALEVCGLGANPDPSCVLDDWFTIICGQEMMWGETMARCLIFRDKPCIVCFIGWRSPW